MGRRVRAEGVQAAALFIFFSHQFIYRSMRIYQGFSEIFCSIKKLYLDLLKRLSDNLRPKIIHLRSQN